jgi:hypothetical protein
LGSEAGFYLDLFADTAKRCGLRYETIPSCKVRAKEEAYDPSERFDSGMTRSRVLGSTAMPDGVVSGNNAGLDMAQLWEDTVK